MEANLTHYLLLLIFFLTLTLPPPTSATTFNDTPPPQQSWSASIGECNQDLEILMESEISRRFLEQKRYISPGALKRDQPVCNNGRPGEPYSSGGGCVPEPSNPYHRGCSRYYQCRGDQ